MTATFNELTKAPKFNPNHRKDNHFANEYAAIAIHPDGRAYDAVILRTYLTDSRAYACVWVHGNCAWREYSLSEWRAATGIAGGYGYHRESAAAEEAIIAAGITLDEHIGGRGTHAIQEAVFAIARALIPHEEVNIYIHHAHA